MLKPGFEYVFSLNVSEPATGLWGSASMALTPNRPPKAGNCTVTPHDSVHLLENVVSFNCSGTAICLTWIKVDLKEETEIGFVYFFVQAAR